MPNETSKTILTRNSVNSDLPQDHSLPRLLLSINYDAACAARHFLRLLFLALGHFLPSSSPPSHYMNGGVRKTKIIIIIMKDHQTFMVEVVNSSAGLIMSICLSVLFFIGPQDWFRAETVASSAA